MTAPLFTLPISAPKGVSNTKEEHGPGEVSVKGKKLNHPGRSLAGGLVTATGTVGAMTGFAQARVAAQLGQRFGGSLVLGSLGLAAAVAGAILMARSSSQHDIALTKTALATNFSTLEEAKAAAAKIDRSRASDYRTSVQQTVDGTYAVFDQGRDYDQQPAPWVPDFSSM